MNVRGKTLMLFVVGALAVAACSSGSNGAAGDATGSRGAAAQTVATSESSAVSDQPAAGGEVASTETRRGDRPRRGR